MNRDQVKQELLNKAIEAENSKDTKDYIDAYCSLEKNDISAEKNSSDYEIQIKKQESDADLENQRLELEAERVQEEVDNNCKKNRIEIVKKTLEVVGIIGAAIFGNFVAEKVKAKSKHEISDKIIYAEKHDDLYVNGNKYNDRQFN